MSKVWGGVEWCGKSVVWSGVEWCGVVWSSVEWCGVGEVWYGVEWDPVSGVQLMFRASHNVSLILVSDTTYLYSIMYCLNVIYI